MPEATDYVADTYSVDRASAENAIHHFLRSRQAKRQTGLSNRRSQANIIIPPTEGHPTPTTIPVAAPPGNSLVQPNAGVNISATPDTTPQQKIDDLVKPQTDGNDNRQQQLINSIKSCKVAIGELAKSMYQLDLTDENSDKVVSKLIEFVSNIAADQTAETTLSLASPLIGKR
jgi:hypothetical protein